MGSSRKARGSSPFVPGWPRPLYLAGRRNLLEEFESNVLGKWEGGLGTPPMILHGVRGVGKSALLDRFASVASDHGWVVAAPQKSDEDVTLRTAIWQAVKEIEDGLSTSDRLSDNARSLLPTLREMRGRIGAGIDPPPPDSILVPVADEVPMSLSQDLARLFRRIGEVVSEDRPGAIFFLDEIQTLAAADLRALIYALDEVAHVGLPVTMVAAGLPQVVSMCRAAGGYAERLNYQAVTELNEKDTIAAFRETAIKGFDDFEVAAGRLGYEYTGGYPQFIQVYGDVAWAKGEDSPISVRDMERARPVAQDRLDRGFFAGRMSAATPAEQDLMFAMARLGDEPHRGSEIAREMGVEFTNLGRSFASLLAKGLIHQAQPRGPYQFSVPRFGEYLRALEGQD